MKGKDEIVIEKMIKYCKDSVKYVEGLDYDAFVGNELVLTFSIFSLSQLGELASKLSNELKQQHIEVPWDNLRGIRNRIVHDYDGVQHRIIWDSLKNDIPTLIKQLRNI